MYCCQNCFTDKFIKKHILVNKATDGNCEFCQNENIPLIEAEKLSNLFENLIDIYKSGSSGDDLTELIQSDWEIFNIQDVSKRKELLLAISNGNIDLNQNFVPIYSKDQTNIELWELFREELKHKNRFFPDQAPTLEIFEPLGKFIGVKIKEGSQIFYRARINSGKTPIEISEMGKPPQNIVSNGRANPIGIPYLYLASSIDTAIAEIRGHRGEIVTIAEFIITKDIELADLRNIKNTISPFELDDGEIEIVYKNVLFLDFLGKELSKPVIPREANLEYLPSQYLSELIKHIGFHGIIYRSSVSDGDNYVIFDDKRLEANNTSQYEITEVLTKSIQL